MSWFKVDDGAAFHRKVLAAGNEAFGAWVRAGAWSSAPANLTEGWIPSDVAKQIAPPRVWKKLRDVGLTEPAADGRPGEQIHDFTVYNPSAAKVRSEREKWAERQRKARESRRDTPPDSRGESRRDMPPEDAPVSRRDIAVTHGGSHGGVTGVPFPIPFHEEEKKSVGTGEPGTVPGPLRGAGVSFGGGPGGDGPEPGDDLPDGDDGPEQVALPLGDSPPASPRRGRDLPAEAHALYVEGWRANKGKGKAPILDDKRRKLIRARLKDFDAADILDAARGAWASSWWRDNDRNEFDRVFKDSQNVERFRDFWRSTSAQSDDGASADPNDLPPTAVRYDRLPEPPVFREPRAEVIPSLNFGDDP